MVLKDGYRPEHFVAGPLVRAMRAGGVLYVEELNRAPSGALNALLTALSDGYVEVPRLGRVQAAPGFTVVGAANPLDDVGTARLSRGLADRFLVIELDYQPRDEELEIVRRRSGSARAGLHPFAVDIARASREHVDLRHGASVRGAIDYADLLSGYALAELDLDMLRALACSAYAGRLRVKPSSGRTAREIVHELIDAILARDYEGSVDVLLEHAAAAPVGDPAESDGAGAGRRDDEAEAAVGTGDRPPDEERTTGARPTTRSPACRGPAAARRASRASVPMVDRDQPAARGARTAELHGVRDTHLRDPEAVMRAARELDLRARQGVPSAAGPSGAAAAQRALERGPRRAPRRRRDDRRVRRRGRHAAARGLPAPRPRAAGPPLPDPRRPLGLDGRAQARGRRDDGGRARAALRRGPRAATRCSRSTTECRRSRRSTRIGTSRTSSSASCACPRAARPTSAASCGRGRAVGRAARGDRRDPHLRLHADPRGHDVPRARTS